MLKRKFLKADLAIGLINSGFILISLLLFGCGTGGAGAGLASNANIALFSGFSSPIGIAVDQDGNIWITNASTSSTGDLNGTTVTELKKSSGYASQTFSGMSGPMAIAIDSSGNVWVANAGGNSVTEMISPGFTTSNIFTGSVYFNGPEGIAVDGNGNVWVANTGAPGGTFGNTVTEILAGSTSCALSSCIAFSDITYFQSPLGIAADKNGNIWVANAGGIVSGVTYTGGVTEIKSGATSCTSNSCERFFNSTFWGSVGIAVDPSGDVWVSIGIDYSTNPISPGASVVEIIAGTTTCTPTTCINFSDPNYFYGPFGIAVDGASNVWVASAILTNNGAIQMITEIKSGATSCSFSTCALFSGDSYPLNNPNLIGIDGFGNVWVTNPGFPSGAAGPPAGTTVIEFKKMASPTSTPLL